jgi:hypothetical protein
MSDDKHDCRGISRREMLRRTAAAAAAAGFSAGPLASLAQLLAQEPQAGAQTAPGAARPRSRVIVVSHPEVLIRDYRANRGVMEQMIERGLRELTGADSAEKAWRQVAQDGDRVSAKTTRSGGDNLKTHDEIGFYIQRRLSEAARVDREKILIWDRPDLRGALLETGDPFRLPTSGRQTRLRAVLQRDVTAIINLPVLKTHHGTGVSISLKNHFGSINNPSAFHGWEDGMWRHIAEVNALEPIRRNTRLVVCDATMPLFEGGPADEARYRWNANALIIGFDPVAVERVGLQMLLRKREAEARKPWPLPAAEKMLEYAEELGLGNTDPRRIDLVELKLG